MRPGPRAAHAPGAPAEQAGPAATGRHPRHDLDPLLLHGVRFSLLAVVLAAEKVAFAYLRDELQVSDSVLSRQLTALEEAGHLEVDKVAEGRRTRTWVRGTPAGRAAFDRHRAALVAIAGG
ncbi:winged helix-turn-helix domain-containing protein [Aquipuribacter hungaricus]|uniref:Winged helix-turn-helix domain-containing protein n=1 Tax=Aquipuribacter hungaricus TaxID=545624 RepID=A0ABV7WIJ6_9MICO